MTFIGICWLIVKICAGLVALFLTIGFTAKQITKARESRLEKEK